MNLDRKRFARLTFLAILLIFALVGNGLSETISNERTQTASSNPAGVTDTQNHLMSGGDALLLAGGDTGGNILHFVPNGLFVNSTDAVQIFLSTTGRYLSTFGKLHQKRELASATALPDGRILIAGGLQCTNGILGSSCKALDSAEIADPRTGRITKAGGGSSWRMTRPRAGHTATLITGCGCPLDGMVLITGGTSGTLSTSVAGIKASIPTDTAEVYDPREDKFIPINAHLVVPREWHSAVLLEKGRVLLVGGDKEGFFTRSTASAEIFDPAKMAFVRAGQMVTPRELACVTVLDPNVVKGPLAGKVIITGGLVAQKRLLGWTERTSELYDPVKGVFVSVNSLMSAPRVYHSALLFTFGPLKGKVLVSGGLDLHGDGSARGVRQQSVASADIFDPSQGENGAFVPTGSLNEARSGHAFALLTDGPNQGEVLVVGGENCDGKSPSFCYIVGSREDSEAKNPAIAAELFDPATGDWTPVRGTMPVPVSAAAYATVAH